MTTTPRGATDLAEGQALPETTVNENTRFTEAGACHFPVVDNDLTAPPGTCADGANYIIAATATGAWTGKEGQIATAVGTNAANGWLYHTPVEGFSAWIQDENALHYYDGAAWALLATGGAAGDVVGPGSATDEAIARFDGTTGKLIQNSTWTMTDAGVMTYSPDGIGGSPTISSYNAVGAGTAYTVNVRRARGSVATPSKTLSGDRLGGMAWFTHDGAAFNATASANILILATEDGDTGAGARIQFRACTPGTSTQVLAMEIYSTDVRIGAASIRPSSNDGSSLGISGTAFSDLFLASGAVIDFNAGDVTITHSSNALAVAGGQFNITGGGDLTPAATPSTTAIGYLGAPQMSDQDDYTLVMADAGKHYYHVSATPHTLTIPANASVAFPIGTVIGIVNENGAGNITLAITSDTLRWGSSTGSRTIAANGTATLLKVTSTVWRLTGDGIS